MIKCSLCEGEKGWKELITFEWDDPPECKWITCWECQGKGSITQLQDAINKARGKVLPIPFKGYA